MPSSWAPSPTTEAAADGLRGGRASAPRSDVAQVQDTESGAEVMHLAETGLCEHGEQENLIQSGATAIDGDCRSTPTAAASRTATDRRLGLRQVHEMCCISMAGPVSARYP